MNVKCRCNDLLLQKRVQLQIQRSTCIGDDDKFGGMVRWIKLHHTFRIKFKASGIRYVIEKLLNIYDARRKIKLVKRRFLNPYGIYNIRLKTDCSLSKLFILSIFNQRTSLKQYSSTHIDIAISATPTLTSHH